ncbi:MAG: hypothetical protein AAGF83_02285 [Cyanobacteria bacterium P01_G01_bin.67]
MTTVTNLNQTNFGIGGTSDRFTWHFKGQEYQVAYETLGQGKPILLLPAFMYILFNERGGT